MTSNICENMLIQELTKRFDRSPDQRNAVHETDAEIITISDSCTIAMTTDSIAEEISTGLYRDPYLAGWMAVMVNMSDLAAVGARQMGIVMSEVLPRNYSENDREELQRGIAEACRKCETFVLGGDTNVGDQLLLSGTALGTCPGGRFLSRKGTQPGDFLFCTGTLGIGNAFAAQALLGQDANPSNRINYLPSARLHESRTLLEYASACMDSSDGVLATLDQMMRLNGAGFDLRSDWESALDQQSKEFALSAGIPPWLLLAGEHGEFELLFTVPQSRVREMYDQAENDDWQPMFLGRVRSKPAISFMLYGENTLVDTGMIRNIASTTDGNIREYLDNLLKVDSAIRKGALHHGNDGSV